MVLLIVVSSVEKFQSFHSINYNIFTFFIHETHFGIAEILNIVRFCGAVTEFVTFTNIEDSNQPPHITVISWKELKEHPI